MTHRRTAMAVRAAGAKAAQALRGIDAPDYNVWTSAGPCPDDEHLWTAGDPSERAITCIVCGKDRS